MPAADMKHGLHQKLGTLTPQRSEGDLLGVAEEPGGLVVQGIGAVVEGSDPQRDRQLPALGPEFAAGGRGMHGGKLARRGSGTTPLPFFRLDR